ncbi:LuxR family transcriptional regulator [Gymnodinialimonas sp. 2305UL16-5]|uniref:helix-turn-helix transcriptional regulator n=1 Tax=Gymnodinialimonas mytili TaxID=3126503 RepID=UPI00309DA58A
MGYTVFLDYTLGGPKFFCCTYPQSWQEDYDTNRFYHFDPVFLQAVAGSKPFRWSQSRIPDLRGVMEAARSHGLKFGCTFSMTSAKGVSLVSIARDDREVKRDEADQLPTILKDVAKWYKEEAPHITARQTEVLSMIANGLREDEIAETLGISVQAVKNRLHQARKTTGSKTTAELVVKALAAGLIQTS